MRNVDQPYIETDHKGNIYLYWMDPSSQSWHETLVGKLRHIQTTVELELWANNMPGSPKEQVSIKMNYLKPQQETLFSSGPLTLDNTNVSDVPPHDC
jgi:hypothetical protein